ncbi:unnamed protein product, partial [Rotaria sp. Silwood2]
MHRWYGDTGTTVHWWYGAPMARCTDGRWTGGPPSPLHPYT